MRSDRSLAGLLAGIYLLLLVYASLYPFEGWRWPAGAQAVEILRLQWPPWRNRFDEWANLLGYVPFGAMLFTFTVRSGGSPGLALLLALLGPAALSYALEVLQHFIPRRFPSMRDWVNNVSGTAAGAALAWLAQLLGLMDLWRRVRERWFLPHSSAAVFLILIWPVGLLFPTPVPLGLGQIGPEIRDFLNWALAGTPYEGDVGVLIGQPARAHEPLTRGRESLVIGLGLLAPCLVAAVVTRRGWRRWVLAPVALSLAMAIMTLSTALNFGPDHAVTWLTPATLHTLLVACALGLVLALAGPRVSAAIGLVAVTAMVVIVNEAPADPYYAASLQGWEQGRFIRFHGLAQWIGLLWPYAAMGWLISRLAGGPR